MWSLSSLLNFTIYIEYYNLSNTQEKFQFIECRKFTTLRVFTQTISVCMHINALYMFPHKHILLAYNRDTNTRHRVTLILGVHLFVPRNTTWTQFIYGKCVEDTAHFCFGQWQSDKTLTNTTQYTAVHLFTPHSTIGNPTQHVTHIKHHTLCSSCNVRLSTNYSENSSEYRYLTSWLNFTRKILPTELGCIVLSVLKKRTVNLWRKRSIETRFPKLSPNIMRVTNDVNDIFVTQTETVTPRPHHQQSANFLVVPNKKNPCIVFEYIFVHTTRSIRTAHSQR